MTNDNECGICGRVLEEHAPLHGMAHRLGRVRGL